MWWGGATSLLEEVIVAAQFSVLISQGSWASESRALSGVPWGPCPSLAPAPAEAGASPLPPPLQPLP